MVVLTPFLLILITVITTIAGVSVATYILVTQDSPDVPPVVIVCSNGTHIENGSCVSDSPPVIPPVVNDTVPPIVCGNGTENYNGTCVPTEVPPVEQPPVVNDTVPPVDESKTVKVIMVGDVDGTSAGNAVLNQIKTRNPDLVAVLGDLGYDKDLNWFASSYGSLGDKLTCVIGNHEADNEDGNPELEKQAIELCGSDYYVKLVNNVLLLGINTNANLDNQLNLATALISNPEFMDGIKSVHIMSHKGCKTPPNSHHPASEDKAVVAFCDTLKSKVPSGVQLFFDSGHNHVMSASADGQYKQSGAGGRSHYECGTNVEFPFCDNKHYGFLEYMIKPDGTTSHSFVDSNGGIVK